MSLKKKLVTTIGMFCLTCALLLVGVWAISNASVEIGGTISFNATNILATITGKIDGAAAGTTNPDDLVYTTTEQPDQDALATWKKNLAFKDTGDTITYTITIKNDSENRSILLSLVDNSAIGGNTNISQAIALTVNGESAIFDEATEYTIEPEKTAVVVATFTVDADKSGEATYGYEINLRDEFAEVPAIADKTIYCAEVVAGDGSTSYSLAYFDIENKKYYMQEQAVSSAEEAVAAFDLGEAQVYDFVENEKAGKIEFVAEMEIEGTESQTWILEAIFTPNADGSLKGRVVVVDVPGSEPGANLGFGANGNSGVKFIAYEA